MAIIIKLISTLDVGSESVDGLLCNIINRNMDYDTYAVIHYRVT